MKETVKQASELQPGDWVVGREGSPPFPVGPLMIARIVNNNRNGQRIGPRLYWSNKSIHHLNAKDAHTFVVLIEGPPDDD